MINLYTLLAAIFLIIVPFRLYLLLTDQHVHFHIQNTSNGKLPLWRDGRCWWSLYFNDSNKGHKYYPGPGLRLAWYLGKLQPLGIELEQAGEEFDIKLGLGFLFGKIWVTLEGTRFFRWLYRNVYRMGWGYNTEIALYLGYLQQYELVIYFLYNDMASGPSLRIRVPKWKWLYDHQRRTILGRRWNRKTKLLNLRILRNMDHLEIHPLPRGIHFWWAKDFMKSMPTGGGWRFAIDFDHIVLGSYEREVENLGEAITREIPIEPDNRLGLHYFASFQRQAETRWRSHFPWRKKRAEYWEISSENPPLHAGKGESSYDLDDDGIFGCSVTAEMVEEAVAQYVEKCQRDRKKYGLPGVIYQEQRRTTQQ